jgi:hypothetical protein
MLAAPCYITRPQQQACHLLRYRLLRWPQDQLLPFSDHFSTSAALTGIIVAPLNLASIQLSVKYLTINKSCASCGLIVLWGGGSSSPSADFVASAHWEKMTSVTISEFKSNYGDGSLSCLK